jgi:hypothetical protein
MTEPTETITLTPDEAKDLCRDLGISLRDMAWLLCVDERRFLRFLDGKSGIHPLAHVVMNWFSEGFRPAELQELIASPRDASAASPD